MIATMKRKMAHPSFVLLSIIFFAWLAVSHFDMHTEWRKKPRTLPTLVSTLEKYRLYSGSYRVNEIPWIFDGGTRTRGKVLATWNADSAATKAACNNEWAKDRAYFLLCGALEDNMILAVDVDNTDPALIVYVPVARRAKILSGQDVVFTAGHVTWDGSVQFLPKFVHAFPN
ncbi:hypothetical protein ACI48D_22575 [Massilia sp. LXY-6]|uniref:hypothetical protein n=1 Tax=Massilia sp. LXY-6 TaxID=3379823 RepID=UPI003EE13ABE